MRNRSSSLLWGAVFIIAGIGFTLRALGIVDFNIFFNGWWTLFIIIPSAVDIIQKGPKPFAISFFIIGVLLLLSCQGIFHFQSIEKLIVPFILIIIGLNIVAKNFGFSLDSRVPKLEKSESKEYSAVMSGNTVVYGENETFTGATLNSIFGSVNLDLRDCIIDRDTVIDCTSVFGGVDIYIPIDVNVKVSSTPIFGGVSNKRHRDKFMIESPTIYINAVCMFGGVDIK